MIGKLQRFMVRRMRWVVRVRIGMPVGIGVHIRIRMPIGIDGHGMPTVLRRYWASVMRRPGTGPTRGWSVMWSVMRSMMNSVTYRVADQITPKLVIPPDVPRTRLFWMRRMVGVRGRVRHWLDQVADPRNRLHSNSTRQATSRLVPAREDEFRLPERGRLTKEGHGGC